MNFKMHYFVNTCQTILMLEDVILSISLNGLSCVNCLSNDFVNFGIKNYVIDAFQRKIIVPQ